MVVGLALRDIIPWWVAMILPLRDLLLWGLVPLLRTRGYSALPVHFLGKAATFNLLYAFPLLLLGDGDGRRRHAGPGVRLGVRLLGDRALLVGRRPLRLAGAHAAARHRAARHGGGRRCLSTRAPRRTPELPEHVTTPLLTLITQQSLDEDYAHVAAAPGRARRDAAPHAAPRPHRMAAVVIAVFGLLVTVAAVQTSRNADVQRAPAGPR